ncbi:MAG TPA: hypothetical protein VEF06_01120 [Bryobacteraceae bacterium]|nr:hypothetical protein [Bryobacteraceae bacterium]
MTVAIKNKPPVVISQTALRKAGFRRGQDLEIRSEEGKITIVPKLTPDEAADREEIRNPKIQSAIRQGYEEFLAGRARPASALQKELDAISAKQVRKRRRT